MSLRVLAFGCHPDDIEFLMSGTLFLLKSRGAEIHYMNPANGCLGSNEHSVGEITEIRRNEGKMAAEYLGAKYYESVVNDLEVFYTHENVLKATAVVREIEPHIMLVTSLEDYMEDHMNAARLGYTAAFCRGMKNIVTIPPRKPVMGDIAVYHAMPFGLLDGMGRAVRPDFFIDIDSVMDKKRTMLAMHESQKNWLDETQGMNAYVETMAEQAVEVGRMSGAFARAEGWRRHNPLGLCAKDAKPLEDALMSYMHQNNQTQ